MKKQLLAALLVLAFSPWALADIRIGVSIAQEAQRQLAHALELAVGTGVHQVALPRSTISHGSPS